MRPADMLDDKSVSEPRLRGNAERFAVAPEWTVDDLDLTQAEVLLRRILPRAVDPLQQSALGQLLGGQPAAGRGQCQTGGRARRKSQEFTPRRIALHGRLLNGFSGIV